jgi:hypothetical protein
LSDVSQGPGWWQASDGKWYAPEQHPNYQPPPPSPATAPAPVAAPPPAPAPVAVAPQLRGASAPLGPGWWQASDGLWYPPQLGYPPQVGYPPQPGFPPQAGPKKPVYKRVWFWLVMIVAAITILIVVIVAAASNAIIKAARTNHTIVYGVTGSGTANITYDSFDNGHNGSAQNSDVSLPWTKTIVGSGIFNYYTVTATLSEAGGTLTCSISVDGRRISTNSANGAFASASCSGTS